jgi:hypothetical protein
MSTMKFFIKQKLRSEIYNYLPERLPFKDNNRRDSDP